MFQVNYANSPHPVIWQKRPAVMDFDSARSELRALVRAGFHCVIRAVPKAA